MIQRLIDANALLNEMRISGKAAYMIVQEAPTVDAVPIVRCKNCRYSFRNNGHDKNGCPITDSDIWMDDNGFCSFGEIMDLKGE